MINLKKLKNVGIVGFGGYLPANKIKVSEIARVWGKNGEKISKTLGVLEKRVADLDEDTITMGVEAASLAMKMAKVEPKEIGAIFVASESHPYAVKPSGTIIGEILGIGREYFCADLQFACKAGTTGIQIIAAFLDSGLIDYGLVIASDKAQSKPGDVLEFTTASGAAAFVLGRKRRKVLTEIEYLFSFNSDTPDFWRRDGEIFPSHLGRFTGEPGYFYHTTQAVKRFFKETKTRSSDFNYVIFHMPNEKFPKKVAEDLGFSQEQLEPGLIVKFIGNPYSASSLLGLIKVLSIAKKGERILLASYGSGAGSDVLSLKIKKTKSTKDFLNKAYEIDYSSYLRKMEVI